MKFVKLAVLATAIAATPIAANAQDAGTTVYGNDDAPIGTVESNADGIVTVDTGTHKAPLPANLLAEREIGWTVNATKAQIDGMMAAQVAEANAKRDAALVVGAAVNSADGSAAGSLTEVDLAGDAIVLESANGPVALKKEHFAVDASGTLVALFTVEQLATAAASAQAATGASE
ncbi:hypothetical protein [uncultured Erythrobacter sp.]|uniref:hypothetical protein n=1 Tax=uncultured Erythrobacter sp. TaxID=263913 RepID=UPI00260E9B5B|nr:hypothetical protein [uncultured Erythrobacter sp.]